MTRRSLHRLRSGGGLGAFVIALLLLSAPPARAQAPSFELPVFGETTFQLTSTSLLRYRGDNYDNRFDDDFVSLYQRLDASLQGEELRLEVRVDAFLPIFQVAPRVSGGVYDEDNTYVRYFWNPSPCEEAGFATSQRCYLSWDLRPERLVLRWESGEWTVEGGDTQLVFGRGIALSFRKVDLLGVDNSLRGLHVRYRGPDFQFGVHGGLANPQNQDPLDLSIIEEPEDLVLGATAGVNVPGDIPITIGVHGVSVWFAESSDGPFSTYLQRPEGVTGLGTFAGRNGVDVLGWSVEAPALADGMLAVYAEADMLRRETSNVFGSSFEYEEDFGRAFYSSVQLQLERITLLLEFKEYRNFLVAPSNVEGNPWRIYNAAPNIEFDGPQRLRGLANQRGGSIRFDYAFLPGPWSFSVNSALFGLGDDENEARQDPSDGFLVTHSWIGLARRQEYGDDINWGFNATVGSRFEFLLHDIATAPAGVEPPQAGDIDRWMIHGDAEVTVGSGDHSVDVTLSHRHERTQLGGAYDDFEIGAVSATYSYGVPLALTLGLAWTDFQESIVDQRDERGYNFLGGEMYPFLEARYTFQPGTFMSVFVGSTPGGQICSGGVCRDVPPYEGFRLQFVGRL
jgi:hypothetical protein